MAPPLQLQLRQSPQVQTSAGLVLPLALADAALLAWLALEGATPRARLGALLWPHSTAEAARNSLRQRLFKLRRDIGLDLVTGAATLSLAPGVQHDLADADTVLGDAVGPFAPEFNGWLQDQRAARREHIRLRLAEACEAAERAQRWPEALAGATSLLALDALSEAAHRLVIRLHYLAGDRAAALLAYERCAQMLRQEFGAQPSAPTLALRDTLRQADAQVSPAPQPGATLPAALLRPPRMVGRQSALQAVLQALRSGHIAACVAEAGMGKTRLAQALQELPAWAEPLQVLDDLHIADAALLTALRASLGGTAGQGRRVVLMGRPPAPGSAWQALLDALADSALLVPVALPPLDEAALADLLNSLLIEGLDGDACAAALHAHTGGNPLYVLDTLRCAWAQDLLADAAGGQRPWPQAAGVMGLIARRLHQLSAAALALAHCACVAGDDFSIEMAQAVLGLPAIDLSGPLAELLAAQVLSDMRFHSNLTARAVAQGLPLAVARHLHGRVAQWLQARAALATPEQADAGAAALGRALAAVRHPCVRRARAQARRAGGRACIAAQGAVRVSAPG